MPRRSKRKPKPKVIFEGTEELRFRGGGYDDIDNPDLLPVQYGNRPTKKARQAVAPATESTSNKHSSDTDVHSSNTCINEQSTDQVIIG